MQFRKMGLCRALGALASVVCGLLTGFAYGAEPASLKLDGHEYFVLKAVEDPQYDFALTLQPRGGAKEVAAFALLFGLQGDKRDGYRISLDKGAVLLEVVRDGKGTPLLRGRYAPGGGDGNLRLQVRRRLSALDIYFNGQPVIESLDSTYGPGQVAVAVDVAPVALRDWTYQKYETIRKIDGFMRTPEEKGDWQNLCGDWKLWTVRESETRHPEQGNRIMVEERSANFFAYTGAGDPYGVSVTGYPFWDCYRVEASVHSADGAVGLAFYVQDDRNFYAARWWLTSARDVPQPFELVRVRDGKETVFARALVKGAAKQWYRLQVTAVGEYVSVGVDGTEIFDVKVRDWYQGAAGLYVFGAAPATFDDFAIHSEHVYRFDRAERVAQCGEPQAGRWRVDTLAASGIAGEVPRCRIEQRGGGEAFYWLGDPSWRQYMISSRVQAPARGAVGLAAHRRDSSRVLIFRCGSVPGKQEPMAQLLEGAGGKYDVLVEAPLAMAADAPHKLALDLTDPGRIAAFVDERLVLRAADPDAGPCRGGVYTLGAARAQFTGTSVMFTRPSDVSKVVKKPLFATDRYMAGWASGAMAWVQAKGDDGLFWHKSDFYGRVSLSLPPQRDVVAYLSAENEDATTGYEVALSGGEPGAPATVALKRAGKQLAAAAIPAAGNEKARFVVTHDGNYVWAALDDKDLFSYRDPQPLTGRHVGLRPAGLNLDNVEVEQYQVMDYLFEQAPVDWRSIGTWEVTNRFVCDPRWSWFATTEWQGLGALWNKYAFSGDFTVEFYAGMRMARDRGLSYPRTGDINAAICVDGRDLSSGYNIITGAWDPAWSNTFSYILRGNIKVAATDRELIPRVRERSPSQRAIPVSWDPGGRAIHGAWYYFRIRKRGDEISYSFDNVPVMAFRDPAPLAGKHVAIWTQDNTIIIARVRVAYDNKETVPLAVKPLPVDGDVTQFLVRDEAPGPAGPGVVSASHPGVACDFERDFCGWQNDDDAQGALLLLDRETAPSGKACLRLTNLQAGGTFGARLGVPAFDAARVAALRFRYRIPAEAKVNLYFTIDGRDCFLPLTGLTESTPLCERLDGGPAIVADNQWHEASVDLAALVRDLYGRRAQDTSDAPAPAAAMCSNVRIGNYHDGYLRAGFGGNPEGMTMWLDDFDIISLGGPDAEFAWTDEAGVQYRGSLSPDAPAEPGDNSLIYTGAAAFKAPGDGLWYFNLSEKRGEASWAPARRLAFRVDAKPVQIAAVTPADGAAWSGDTVQIQFDKLTAAAIDPAATSLKVGDVTVPCTAPVFTFNWAKRRLDIDLANAALPALKDKEHLSLTLTVGLRYPAGDTQAVTKSWSCAFALVGDHTSPSVVTLTDYPLYADFEQNTGGLTAGEGNVLVERDAATAASGRYSLRVAAKSVGSPMSFYLTQKEFHAGRVPVLAFDYRMSRNVISDLLVQSQAKLTQLRFSDVDETTPLVGAIDGVVRDDTWRHAEINLRKLYCKGTYDPAAMRIRYIGMRDTGYVATPPGLSYAVDNVTLAPVVSAAKGIALAWSAADMSGIAGYACAWSADPNTEPPAKVTTPESKGVFHDIAEGTAWFHVRAVDTAGNWGPTAHYRFLVDNQAPQLTPAAGNNAPLPEVIHLKLTDAGEAGADYESLKLAIDGKDAALNAHLAVWNADTGEMQWDWLFDQPPADGPRPDKSQVAFRATGIADFAGNAAAPLDWRLRVDYAADKSAPSPVDVAVAGKGVHQFKTFTRDLDKCIPYGGSLSALSRAVRDGRDGVLEVEAVAGNQYGVYLSRKPFRIADYPYVEFDYRFAQNHPAHLALAVDGKNFTISLSSYLQGYEPAGKVAGARLDNAWHHAILDLRENLKGKLPPDAPGRVQWIVLGDLHQGAPRGASFWIDNFIVYGPVTATPTVTLSAWDASGISGYSYVVDAKSDTEAAAKVPQTKRELSLAGMPVGKCYLHVRACDGAGNWGKTVHVPFDARIETPAAAPTAAADVVLCPKCGRTFPRGNDKNARELTCPHCGAKVTLAAAEVRPAAEAAPAAK